MALEKHHTMTIEEYFELDERDPNTRYEYEDGYVYAMAGGTVDHATISLNLCTRLKSLLRGKRCHVYNSDIKVPVAGEKYYHPDVMIACGPRDAGTSQIIRAPRVIIEVLSPTTEITDRTRKLKYYRAHPTIQEYLLVDSRRVKAEIYRRKDGTWIYEDFEENAEIVLESLGIRFPLMDAYADVEFEEILEDDDFDD